MTADDRSTLEILFAASAVLFALGFWIRRRERAALQWPQVPGVIVTSKTDPETEPQSFGRSGHTMVPVIEYEFNYQGQPYRTSHWRFANVTIGNRLSAESAISRYPIGRAVTVFVNVRKPENSVLETKALLWWIPLWFGILCLALTVLNILIIIQKAEGR